jgi:protein-disulfide isomerase
MSHDKDQERKEQVVFKTPPKMAFLIGILSGVTLTALVAFGMMYSVLKTEAADGTLGSSNAKVAGAEIDADNPSPAPTPAPAPTKVDIAVTDDDHIRGDKDSAVTLIQYTEFECPFSARVQPTIDQILEDYKGKVKLIFRHFPLSFHQNAQKAAEASECAADQGKFWEMHDIMFENQTALDIDSLKSYAKGLGLNTLTFNSCLDSGKYEKKVKDDFTEGGKYGVQGTPATFVDGVLVSGAQPYENFQAAVENALAK